MKKTNKANFKKIVGGVLAAVMAAAMVATAVIPAFAADDIPIAEEVPEGVSAAAAATAKKKNVSIVVAKQVKMKDEDVYLGATPAKKGKAKITNSNSKVGRVTTYKQKGSSLVWYYFKPKAVGKTTVTIKAGKTVLKRKITVVKYQNPVASMKIGNAKISNKNFKKSDTVSLSYNKYKKGGKLIVTPNRGFQLAYASAVNKAGAEIEYINAYGNIKPRGGKGNYILMLRFQNMVTGVTYNTRVIFK